MKLVSYNLDSRNKIVLSKSKVETLSLKENQSDLVHLYSERKNEIVLVNLSALSKQSLTKMVEKEGFNKVLVQPENVKLKDYQRFEKENGHLIVASKM